MKRFILTAILAITTVSTGALAQDCIPETSGGMNCTASGRANLQGGKDYSNGVHSRPNLQGGMNYSNGLYSRPNLQGGMDCR